MVIDIFDTYGNNLQKRITIINAIEQDFLEKQKSNLNKSKVTDNNNLKFYFLLKNKEINDDFDIGKVDEINNVFEKNEIILKENENENKISKYIFGYNDNIFIKINKIIKTISFLFYHEYKNYSN